MQHPLKRASLRAGKVMAKICLRERILRGYYSKRGRFGRAALARSADASVVASLLINNSSFLIPDISKGWL